MEKLTHSLKKYYSLAEHHLKKINLFKVKSLKHSDQLYSLSPKENLNDKHFQKYAEYIRDSLNNDDIKNIAITGKYGSGKSSIINSYFNQNGDKDVLRVSFASFKNKQPTGNSTTEYVDENTKTEQGIINQILYQIKPWRIPLTNFKIKRPMHWFVKILYSFELLFFILLFFWFWKKEFLRSSFLSVKSFIENHVQINVLDDVLSYFSNLSVNSYMVFFALIFLLWNTWSFLGHFQIRQFKLSLKSISADINLPNEDLFEKYIDEIIYIFQHSRKHILVLEDIDRFEKIDIFQKLRELNVKLNINNGSKKQWKFIYLIKDDIFDDVVSNKALTRVKFFDLIIPVIPFVTKGNSYDKISELFEHEKLNSRLVDIFSNYIYDYRLLLNIKNEFTIFLNRLGVNDNDKLFALIAYKNIYPDQFDMLQNGEGVMEKFSIDFKQKNNKHKEEVLSEISQLEKKQKQNMANSENEIIALEIYRSGTTNLSLNDIIRYKNYGNQYLLPYDKKSDDKKQQTLKDFMQTDYYKEQLALATDEKYFANQLQKLEQKLDNIAQESWKLVSRDDWFKIIDEEKVTDYELLFALITNGFIDEHYLEVINKYYGNLNNTIFKKNLFTKQNNIDFSLALSDIDRLSSTLYAQDFDEKAILNFSLFQHYLDTKNSTNIRRMIGTANRTESGFIESYLDTNPTDFEKIITITGDRLDLNIEKITTQTIFMKTIISNSFSDTQQNVIDATNFVVDNNLLNEVTEEILKSDSYISLKEQLIIKSNKKYDVSDDFIPEVIKILFKYDRIVGSEENFNKYVEMMDLNEPSFNFDDLLAKYFNKYYEDISSGFSDKEVFDSMLTSSLITDKAFRWSFGQYKKHGLPNYESSIINDVETNNKVNILLDLGLIQFDNDVLEYIIKNNHSLLEYYKYDFLISELVQTKYENSKIDLRTINEISDYPDLESFVIVSRNLRQYGGEKTKIVSLLSKFADKFDDARKVIKILDKRKGAFQSHLSNDEPIINILAYLKDTNFVSDFQLVDDKYFKVKK